MEFIDVKLKIKSKYPHLYDVLLDLKYQNDDFLKKQWEEYSKSKQVNFEFSKLMYIIFFDIEGESDSYGGILILINRCFELLSDRAVKLKLFDKLKILKKNNEIGFDTKIREIDIISFFTGFSTIIDINVSSKSNSKKNFDLLVEFEKCQIQIEIKSIQYSHKVRDSDRATMDVYNAFPNLRFGITLYDDLKSEDISPIKYLIEKYIIQGKNKSIIYKRDNKQDITAMIELDDSKYFPVNHCGWSYDYKGESLKKGHYLYVGELRGKINTFFQKAKEQLSNQTSKYNLVVISNELVHSRVVRPGLGCYSVDEEIMQILPGLFVEENHNWISGVFVRIFEHTGNSCNTYGCLYENKKAIKPLPSSFVEGINREIKQELKLRIESNKKLKRKRKNIYDMV